MELMLDLLSQPYHGLSFRFDREKAKFSDEMRAGVGLR